MHRLAILLGLAGCQLVFPFEPPPPEPDAPLPDAPPRVCDPGTPFPRGTEVGLDTIESVEAARFVGDRDTIFLSLCASPDKSSCDLYKGEYNATTNKYGLFTKLDITQGGVYDSYPTITPDLGFIVFSSTRANLVKVFVGTSVNGKFANAQPLSTNLSFSNEPYLLGDGRTLYFSGGDMAAQDDGRLFRTVGDPPSFGSPEYLAELDTSNQELAPVVTDDEREIFFASNRQETGNPMALDIYTATRTDPRAQFDSPVRVAALSDHDTKTIDWPLWISPDRCDLYYINKDGNQATLYVTSR